VIGQKGCGPKHGIQAHGTRVLPELAEDRFRIAVKIVFVNYVAQFDWEVEKADEREECSVDIGIESGCFEKLKEFISWRVQFYIVKTNCYTFQGLVRLLMRSDR
jgi:hypothetical protein